MPSYSSNSRKTYTLRLLLMRLEGEFWKLFCLGGGEWLTLGKEEFTWGTSGRKLYRLTIKWTWSKTVLRVPSTDCFKSIASHKKCIFLNMSAKHCIKQKMHIPEYVCRTFLEKITFLRREIIAVYNVSKNAALPQVFFCHTLGTVPQYFRSFSKTLSSIPLQQVTLYHSNLCMLYTPNKRCRFTTQ